MNDLKPQNSGRTSRYRMWMFLLVVALISVVLAIYLTRDLQKGQEAGIGTPTPIADSSTSSLSAMLVSPLSPVSPLSAPSESESLKPAAIQLMIGRGLQLYQRGDYTAALKLFNAVVDRTPSDPQAYDARGTTYLALNDYEQALTDYNKAIQLNSSFAQAYYNRGRVYSALKKYDEALSDLQKSAELEPTSFGYRANGNIGRIYHQRGEYEKALKAFETSMSFDNTKADVFYLRGETYTALGNYQAAIADYQSAISRFSRYDLAYQSLGYAFFKTGQYAKATEALKQAIEIAPDSPGAHFYLALVDLATGDSGGASAAMSQAADASSKLPQEDRDFLYTRMATDLKTFAKENPDRAATAESMLKLMPQPQ